MTPARPRLLFLAPRYPQPPERGDQRRVLHLLEGLAAHAEVTLVSFATDRHASLAGMRVRTVFKAPLDTALANVRLGDPRLPLQARLLLSRRFRRVVDEELARSPEVVHVTLSRLGPYLPPPGPWHRHVDLIDSLAQNMRTRARASRGPARWPFALEAQLLDRYEAALVARADSSSVVSANDRRLGPGLQHAAVIPNGVDTDAFGFSLPDARPPTLLFFGNLGYFHNVEPARFVALEVLPLVRARLPAASLRIAGARPTAGVRALSAAPGVEVVGPVAHMADELHGASVAVVPMFSGSGIKNKVLESFSTGTPVVTNAAGIMGVQGSVADRHHLEGETAEELADACVTLLLDAGLRAQLAREGRRLVEDSYSWERQVRALIGLYGTRL